MQNSISMAVDYLQAFPLLNIPTSQCFICWASNEHVAFELQAENRSNMAHNHITQLIFISSWIKCENHNWSVTKACNDSIIFNMEAINAFGVLFWAIILNPIWGIDNFFSEFYSSPVPFNFLINIFNGFMSEYLFMERKESKIH